MAYVMTALGLVLFAVKVFALWDCVTRKPYDFERAETLSKRLWLLILTLAIVVDLVWGFRPLNLLPLAGTVAALVYLAQLRGSDYSW